jgi:hypothetical protein
VFSKLSPLERRVLTESGRLRGSSSINPFEDDDSRSLADFNLLNFNDLPALSAEGQFNALHTPAFVKPHSSHIFRGQDVRACCTDESDGESTEPSDESIEQVEVALRTPASDIPHSVSATEKHVDDSCSTDHSIDDVDVEARDSGVDDDELQELSGENIEQAQDLVSFRSAASSIDRAFATMGACAAREQDVFNASLGTLAPLFSAVSTVIQLTKETRVRGERLHAVLRCYP